MRARLGNWLWGLCIVAFGVLWMLGELNVIEINLFFRGWWTLFIIVPCVISMIQSGINTGNVIGLGVGVVLLLARNDVVNYSIIWPIIVVVVGIGILFKRPFSSSCTGKWAPPPKGSKADHTAVFSGQTVRPVGEPYRGGEATAVFGGVKIDLRQAIIDQDIYIESTSVFGGVEIFLPDHCRVETRGTHIFGGMTNHRKAVPAADAPTVYLENTCIFGGLTIY